MATLTAALTLEEALPLPELSLYPQFERVDDLMSLGLAESIAAEVTSAWRGVITPFRSDEDAKLLARALHRDRSVSVAGGTLQPDKVSVKLRPLTLESTLVNMSEDFDVLILQLETFSHPLVYCLGPEISTRTHRDHPHLRRDLALVFGGGRRIDALCVFSAAEHQHIESLSWIEEYLAQTAIFLAKHLIWCRTSVLVDTFDNSAIYSWLEGGSMFQQFSAETATQKVPRHLVERRGIWLGPPSISGLNHVLLPENGPCWCGRKARYASCCRNDDMVSNLRYFASKALGAV